MDSTALLRLAAGGENSRVQFKVNMTNAVSVAQEIVAFSNSKGGILLIGIDDKTGEVVGLSFDKEELSRLLQSSGNLYAEQMILQQSVTKDIDWGIFREFYEKKYKEEISHEEFAAKVENLSLGEGGKINLAGNLLFGKNPQRLAPDAYVTAIWFHGLEIASTRYHISENIGGDLARVFKDSQKFVMGCLRKVQMAKILTVSATRRYPKSSSTNC